MNARIYFGEVLRIIRDVVGLDGRHLEDLKRRIVVRSTAGSRLRVKL